MSLLTTRIGLIEEAQTLEYIYEILNAYLIWRKQPGPISGERFQRFQR